VLGAAGLADGPIDQPPAAVAALIERTARSMGAPHTRRPPEIRAAAEIQVAEIVARVKASNQAGGLKQVNRSYKAYRQAQIAKAEKATSYAKFFGAVRHVDRARRRGERAHDLARGIACLARTETELRCCGRALSGELLADERVSWHGLGDPLRCTADKLANSLFGASNEKGSDKGGFRRIIPNFFEEDW
jgi:hypothetical protein